MSKKTDKLEKAIEKLGQENQGKMLPNILPDWMITEGVLSGSVIESAQRIGGQNSKTDVIIRLQNSEDIKISAKLSNADYFGNWYGHERVIKEFDTITFERLSVAITEWANTWANNPHADLFVGVCVSFGDRTGETGIPFLDVFFEEDIIKIVKGVGNGEEVANSLFIDDICPKKIGDLVLRLKAITKENVKEAVENFQIICRPVNPIINDTNRGKCIYTRFQPDKKLDTLTEVRTMDELMKYGKFVPVDWSVSYRLNTNRWLDVLEVGYNIYIPRKRKKN